MVGDPPAPVPRCRLPQGKRKALSCFEAIEHGQRVGGELHHPIQEPTPGVYNLTGQMDEALEKLFEFHTHHLLLEGGLFEQ